MLFFVYVSVCSVALIVVWTLFDLGVFLINAIWGEPVLVSITDSSPAARSISIFLDCIGLVSSLIVIVYLRIPSMSLYRRIMARIEELENEQTDVASIPASDVVPEDFCTYIVPNAAKSREEIEADLVRGATKSAKVFATMLMRYEKEGYLDFREEPISDIFEYLKERYTLTYDLDNFRRVFKPLAK